MDHEYSLTGKVWTRCQGNFPQSQEVNGFGFSLEPVGESSEYSIVPLDKAKVAALSDEEVANICRGLSLEFGCRVRLSKLHEEYGLLNVFNGGSDYEVVASDCFTCECDCGNMVSQRRESQ